MKRDRAVDPAERAVHDAAGAWAKVVVDTWLQDHQPHVELVISIYGDLVSRVSGALAAMNGEGPPTARLAMAMRRQGEKQAST